MNRKSSTIALAIALLTSVLRADESRVLFNRDIRPILSENCFFCHGPDKNKRQADVRLDTQAGLAGELEQSDADLQGHFRTCLGLSQTTAAAGGALGSLGLRVMLATLAPGESLSQTVDNLSGSFADKFDHALEIWVDGKPRMQLMAASFKNQQPRIQVWTETIKGKSVDLQSGAVRYINDLDTTDSNLQPTGTHLLIECQREADTRTATWWKPDTRNLVVSLKKIPDEELTNLNPL